VHYHQNSVHQPTPRFAGTAISYDGYLVTLCGRHGGDFFGGETLWRFNVKSPESGWDRIEMAGTAPSPRVWAASALVGDTVMLYGGAEWKFDSSCYGSDHREHDIPLPRSLRDIVSSIGHGGGAVYIGDMLTSQWSQVNLPLSAVRLIAT